jgi:hypothetical protein
MKLTCPWCGAEGHDGRDQKEPRTPKTFQYIILVRHGGKRQLYECLNCGQGVKATRWTGRTSQMPPEDFAHAKKQAAALDAETMERMRKLDEELREEGDP